MLPARFLATATAATTETTAATTATTTGAAATEAARAGFLRTGFVHRQLPATEFLAVARVNGRLRFFLRRHLDKAEAARATGGHVAHHTHGFNRPGLREERFEFAFGGVVGKVADVQFATQVSLTPAFHPWECCPLGALCGNQS